MSELNVGTTMDCRYVEESDLATSYLAGRLSEAEAEAFEQHFLGCDRCGKDVQTLSELRAALGKPAVMAIKGRSAPETKWRIVAAAAVVALMAVGFWQLVHRPTATPNPPVYRGSGETFVVRAESLPEGGIRLSWPSNPGADVYLVEILRSDGVSVWKREAAEPGVTLARAALPTLPPGASIAARVTALDPMRRVISTSELASIPQH